MDKTVEQLTEELLKVKYKCYQHYLFTLDEEFLGGDNANWSTLGREYRFNVGFDVVPEPSTGLLSISALAGLLLLRRRRRR